VPVTTTLKSLHILPPTGMPDVECILIEAAQPEGPYGAKGIGETALAPTAAAIGSAISNAIGVQFKSIPIKPDQILATIKKGKIADDI